VRDLHKTLCLLLLTAVAGCATSGTSSRPGRMDTGYTEIGMATWYGGKHHGGPTASGERFDMHQMTAAHKHLRFGTVVRVEHLGNGRSVVVRINDRGPYGKGRIIDLSRAAAEKLGILDEGVAKVRIVVLSTRPSS
jgi:rare lipoprotein A